VSLEDRRISVAQIGCGYWGPNLLRNLISNKRCSVKTVIDLSPERLDFVRGLYPAVRVSSNSNDVFDDPEINAVVISTPVASHFELAIKALESGKHILVEKPLARTVQEVEKIAILAKQKGLVAMVGHTFLYNAAVRYLKQLVDSGDLGDVRYIYCQRLNLGRIRSDVDALWNFAPHDISILQYLLGDPMPLSVTRHGMSYVQEGIDDVVFLHITYPNKVIANVHVSWLDPHRVRKITVVGSKKMVVYDDTAENKIAIYDKGIEPRAVLGENMDFDAPSFPFCERSGGIVIPKIDYREPLKVEIDHFFDCILNGTPCLTDAKHAITVIRILANR
jgi:predicted dehydrogenase